MNRKLSQELYEALLRYLATKPYAEVLQLISLLQAAPPVEEAPLDGRGEE